MDKVDRLYEIYTILTDCGNDILNHEAEYLEIIEAAKGDGSEKGLACQFIPKFLKQFPNLSASALEAQLDLAKDNDITVRKLAVKHLPGFCKVSKDFVPKISNVLTRMLLAEDTSELANVQAALLNIIEIDVREALQGILTEISVAEEELVRKRAIEFLNSKLKILPEDLLTKEVEEYFFELCKKLFPKVSGQDFLSLLPLLFNLKIAKTIPVQNAIVDIIASQLNVDSEISVDNVTGIIHLFNQASPLFSPFVSSRHFVSFLCLKLFPLLKDLKNLENGSNLILDVFKVLAEISAFIQKDDDMKDCVEIVFEELLIYVPLPPENVSENDSSVADPNLYFTHIECLLFAFAQFLKHNNEFITSVDNANRFKDLKLRLQFLSRVISRDLKSLKDSQKTVIDFNKESKLKAIAERTMNNLNVLIRDFFRNPPAFKNNIILSWKPAVRDLGVKRHYESSSSGSSKRERRAGRELYVPPSGKYSSRLSSKDSPNTGRSSRF